MCNNVKLVLYRWDVKSVRKPKSNNSSKLETLWKNEMNERMKVQWFKVRSKTD